MEKDFNTVLLLDTYSGLLTDKQQRLCDMYYNQDYSLSEIAGIEHTSRQAARDGISKARQKLLIYESTLSLCGKKAATQQALKKAKKLEPPEPCQKIIKEIAHIWEITDGV